MSLTASLFEMTNSLTDDTEVLLRQIHPNFFDNGVPGSNRFRPSEKDGNMLSVDRSALTSAKDAHARYTRSGRKSAAVFGISVGQFRNESIPCKSDPVEPSDGMQGNPAHALADYSAHTVGKQKLVAKRLQRVAIERGCLYSE